MLQLYRHDYQVIGQQPRTKQCLQSRSVGPRGFALNIGSSKSHPRPARHSCVDPGVKSFRYAS